MWHVLWARPGSGGQDADLRSARTSDLASAAGARLAAFTCKNLGQHPPSPVAPTASSWIQCSWTLRRWTTLMRTATSHRSSWRSVRRSACGPTLSGTSSSPCRVSEWGAGKWRTGMWKSPAAFSTCLVHQGWRLYLSGDRPPWIAVPCAPRACIAQQALGCTSLRGQLCLLGGGPERVPGLPASGAVPLRPCIP